MFEIRYSYRLLNVEEAYYEEELREEIQNMVPLVHLLGEGYVLSHYFYLFV